MKKVIKITERQLREATGAVFKYIDPSDDTTPCDGMKNITADGKLNPTKNANPVTTDQVGKTRTNQGFARYRAYANIPVHTAPANIGEGIDADNNGVDDFYDNATKDMDSLSDGNSDNDITKVPQTVLHRIDMLMDAIKPLNDRQRAMVLNRILEEIDIDEIPISWKKTLMYKLKSDKDNPTAVQQ